MRHARDESSPHGAGRGLSPRRKRLVRTRQHLRPAQLLRFQFFGWSQRTEPSTKHVLADLDVGGVVAEDAAVETECAIEKQDALRSLDASDGFETSEGVTASQVWIFVEPVKWVSRVIDDRQAAPRARLGQKRESKWMFWESISKGHEEFPRN